MKTTAPVKSLNRNVRFTESYGINGCTVTLNLAQCQMMAKVYDTLANKIENSGKESLTPEETDIFGFVMVFKDIPTPNSQNVWNSLHQVDENVKPNFDF